MNQSAIFLPRRGNHFSLSPGERAPVGYCTAYDHSEIRPKIEEPNTA